MGRQRQHATAAAPQHLQPLRMRMMPGTISTLQVAFLFAVALSAVPATLAETPPSYVCDQEPAPLLNGICALCQPGNACNVSASA